MTGGDLEHGGALDKYMKNRQQGKFICIIGEHDSEAMENHSVIFYHTQYVCFQFIAILLYYHKCSVSSNCLR